MSNVTIFELEKIAEEQLVFAVIISKYQEKFVYVKHFTLEPLFIYGVEKNGEADYGLVFEAQITDLQDELTSEIEAIYVMAEPPANWTYPTIQPLLLAEYFVRT